MSNAPTLASQGSQKEMMERRGLRKYLNIFLSWERKQSPKSRKRRESHTGLPGEEHAEHTVIKLRKIKERENMKSHKGKATNNIKGNVHKIISGFFRRNSAGQKGVALQYKYK